MVKEDHTVGRMPGEIRVEYQYTMGHAATAFFAALRERRILGSKCASCARVSVPPKSFCEYCFVPIDDLVEVSSRGTVEAVTVVHFEVRDAPPPPYCVAYVRLGGATSSIANYVRGIDLGDEATLPAAVAIGAEVEVAFAPEPVGRITDFWFEPAPASTPSAGQSTQDGR